MAEASRIPCLNPRCRRTADREKMGADCTGIICGKCWRALPQFMRDRHKQLEKRERSLRSKIDRRMMRGTIAPGIVDIIGRRITVPERPLGLGGFLL